MIVELRRVAIVLRLVFLIDGREHGALSLFALVSDAIQVLNEAL